MGGMLNTCASKVEWWNYFKLAWINMFYLIIHKCFGGGGGGERGGVEFINFRMNQSWRGKYFHWFEKRK